MKRQRAIKRGFTIVEILITLVVLMILLGLGVAATTSLQADARDKERATDIETIARSFEERYKTGNTMFKLDVGGFFTPSASISIGQGSYPGVFEIQYAYGLPKSEFDPNSFPQAGDGQVIADAYSLPIAAFRTPGDKKFELICQSSCQPAETQSQVEASFQVNGEYVDRYVYEPIDADGNICSISFDFKRCVRFNLYWRDEAGTIHKYESKKWQ